MSTYIGNPAFKVHEQSGSMRRALKSEYSASKRKYKIWFDKGIAPHAKDVILGTKVMLPRDVMWSTATAPGTKELMMRSMISVLGKTLRSQAVVRIAKTQSESKKLVVLAMKNTSLDMNKATELAQKKAGDHLTNKIDENISMRNYTQADLDALGNPYAKRHGSIRING